MVSQKILGYVTDQGFPNSVKGWGKREWEISLVVDFLSGGGHLRSAFDHSNLFQSKKHHSVNIEH